MLVYINLTTEYQNIVIMKPLNIIACFIILFLFVIFISSVAESKRKRHNYVGISKCENCHSADSIGGQYTKWLRSPHAKGFIVLKTKKALVIAKKHSIEKPAEDRKCLKCHTTGGGRSEITKNEGVGCEACHGPAEDYYEYDKHVDLVNRRGAYEKARKGGMYPTIGIKNIKKREKLCLHCHNKKRQCFPTDSKSIREQTIPLQVISSMRKGKIDLKHSLIPPFPEY